jgi:azurin
MPTAEAAVVRKDLKDVRVAVFVVKAVHEQMRFDTTRLVVEAGKPFEVIVENPDAMPHNFVVVKPGTREKVGMAAMTMPPTKVDSKGRAYVPQSDDVVAATRLLEAGQKETLKVTAPNGEGEYEYVCTFPGHWMVMWGKLIVTKDVDAYLSSHPESASGATASAAHKH